MIIKHYIIRDPVQLNLLYEQAKEAILEGTHPVRLEDAIQFAALQVQIQFGDHKEDKHKVGMLAEWVPFDLFSPTSYFSIALGEKYIETSDIKGAEVGDCSKAEFPVL